MDKISENLLKARILESFCGHDLRGEIGRCISFLGLMSDQLPPEGSEEFREMIELSLRSARSALDELDARLDKNSLETRYVWVYAKDFAAEPQVCADENAVVLRMGSLEEVRRARADYRPDVVLIDGSTTPAEEWGGLGDAIGSPLTEVVLLLPTSRLGEVAALGTWGAQALDHKLDMATVTQCLRARR